ncbi:MAG: hypothetical protein QXP34_00485 [Candidatus Aenigmatarchaeota archaeon]
MGIRYAWKKIKARKLLREGRVSKDFENELRIHFTVKGYEDIHYVIYDKIKDEFSCDCKWFSLKKEECSHILACKMLLESEKEKL